MALKRARQAFAASHGVYIVDGDITDAPLLAHLFDICDFSHVLHLAAQVESGSRTTLCPRSILTTQKYTYGLMPCCTQKSCTLQDTQPIAPSAGRRAVCYEEPIFICTL